MEWTRTRSVLVELGNLLTCAICKSYLKDPCTLDNCDHNFCRKCIEETLGSESKCPECGLFSWVKDLRLNHQLATTVHMTLKLQSLIGVNMEDSEPKVQGYSESLSENTFTFASDKEMPDENCNEEQGSPSGTESVSTIKPGTNTKESDNVGETRQTVNMTQPRTSIIESSSFEKHTRTAETTTTPSLKRNMNESKSTRMYNKVTKQPNVTVQSTRESDSEASHGSAAETTTDTTNSKQRANARNSSTKRNKRSKQPSVTFPRGTTDTESDNESNHASTPEATTESTNVKHGNVRKSTVGRGHKKITKQPSVTVQNDTESDSETNDASIVETTTKSTNVKQHTNVRKLATRRHNKITTQPSVTVQSTRESGSEASHASTAETTTCLKRTSKSKSNRKHNNKTKQASVAVQKGSTGSGTESGSETNHSSSVATTTESTNYAKLRLNVRKSTTVTGHLKNTKQRKILNSATDTESEIEANNASTAATTKACTSVKENSSKSRSNTVRTHNNMTKQRTVLSNTAESDSETNEETTKENTNAKQHTNVRKSARGGNKLSKQPTVMNSATDTQSDSEANNASTAEATSTKERSNMKERTNVRNSDTFRGRKKMTKQPSITKETSTIEPMETESTHIREATETETTKSLHRKNQIVTQKKNSISEKAGHKASGQNVRKKYLFRNKLNPISKTNSNLIGDPFDFTQQEDPFHFSFTEDGDNDSGSDDNDDHDNDDSDHENYDDHDDNNDGHNNDEEDHDSGDDDYDYDDHGNDDGGNKPSLRSISEYTKNTLTRGPKTRGEKSISFEIGHDDVENNKGILQNTRSTNTRLQNKIKSNVTAEHTKTKVQFTHLKNRSTNHDKNDQIGVEKDNKKTSPNGLKHDPTSKVVGDEDKENVTLNIKRRWVRGKRYNIRQYLIDVHHADTPESSSDDAPQKRKKSRNPSTSSSQNTRNNITSSQKSQNAAGSSQKTRNKKGETPLHLAAIKGDLALARELINEGADPNVKDHAGWTPLHEACNHGHVDIVKLFLDQDAFINIPGLDNDTPLHDAVANGRLKVVKLLVARGAVLTARNKQGLLPMDYAVTKAMKAALTPRDVSSSTKPSENFENVKFTEAWNRTKKSSESCRESQVILGTALKTQDQATLKKCVKQLGGTLVDEFDESVTHVVTSVNENGHCPRTIKYLCGILTGKWIVSFEWIKDSSRRRQWLDEDVYEVEGTVGKTCNAARKSRLNILQQMPRLLDGCSFFLRGMFNPPTPSKQDLIKLIQLGRGKLLHREPKIGDDDLTSLPSSPIVTSLSRAPEVAYHAPANSTLSCCTEFILYDSVSCDQPKIVYSPVLRTATVTWLMDCISSFQLLDIPDV